MFFKEQLNEKKESVNLEFGGSNNFLTRYVFILDIEDVDNKLKIILSSQKEGEKGTGIEEVENDKAKEMLKESIPIYPNLEDVYEIVFPSYIIYQTRNESYCSWDDYNIRKGNNLYI